MKCWPTLLALLKSPRTRLGAAFATLPSLPSADVPFPEAAFPAPLAAGASAPGAAAPEDKTAAEEETLANMLEGRLSIEGPPLAPCPSTLSSTLIDLASGARDALLARGCRFIDWKLLECVCLFDSGDGMEVEGEKVRGRKSSSVSICS